MPAHYDYLTFTLERGRPAWSAFVDHARTATAPAIASAGGELLGLFQGQLGFFSNEAVVLLRWPSATRDRLRELDRAPGVAAMRAEILTPTVRPKDDAVLKIGGIYVHRWFTVDADSVADFISLSNRAWTQFEGSYATEIFGLFAVERTAQDVREGVGRLLLLLRRPRRVGSVARSDARSERAFCPTSRADPLDHRPKFVARPLIPVLAI